MESGELKRRQRAKALKLLDYEKHGPGFKPRFTTTEALRLLDANCGAARFHRLLITRGVAKAKEDFDKGNDFSLPSEYGGGTFSIDHHSFHWTTKGVEYMASVLRDEGIAHSIPEKL